MITWWTWPTFIILVFHFSRFNSLESLLDLVQRTAIPHPPGRTTLVIIFYTHSPFIHIGKSITYQYWILCPSLTHSCSSNPQLQWVCDWNIQSCHGWWRHPWLQSSWHSPFQYPRAPIVLPLWSFSYGFINLLPGCSLSWCLWGYLNSEYTGYQYPFLPPCPADNDDEHL